MWHASACLLLLLLPLIPFYFLATCMHRVSSILHFFSGLFGVGKEFLVLQFHAFKYIFYYMCKCFAARMSVNYKCVWYLVDWHKIGYIVTVQLLASEFHP